MDQCKISVEDIAPFLCIVYIKESTTQNLRVHAAEPRKEEPSSIKYTEIMPSLAYRHQSLISRSLFSQSLIQVKENRPRQLSQENFAHLEFCLRSNLRLGDVYRLADHQTSMQDEEKNNGVELEDSTPANDAKGNVLMSPALGHPISHKGGNGQSRRDRGSFEVF